MGFYVRRKGGSFPAHSSRFGASAARLSFVSDVLTKKCGDHICSFSSLLSHPFIDSDSSKKDVAIKKRKLLISGYPKTIHDGKGMQSITTRSKIHLKCKRESGSWSDMSQVRTYAGDWS